MRRSILVAVIIGALVGVATVAGVSLAGSGSGERAAPAKPQGASGSSFRSAYAARAGHGGRRHGGGRRRGHRMGFGPIAAAVDGVADRLGVSRDELIQAVKGVKDRALDRAVSDGTITEAQRDALRACMRAHHGRGSGKRRGGSCDRRAARRAHRRLHRALKQRIRSDAAAVKAQLIGDLADELGKQPAEVEDAIRAELSELLDTGVRLGLVSDRARDLALGCFDRPAQCDQRALRRELRQGFRGHRHGHRGRHP
jgi:hypothetical protein